MKRYIIFGLLLIAIFAGSVQAESIGISPVYYKEFFEPGLEKSFEFYSFSDNPERKIRTYAKGDLAPYVNLSRTTFTGSGVFSVSIKLPQAIAKPGTHKILIGAMEDKGGPNESTFGGIAAIQGRIDIIVPYPGKYTESTFKIGDVNEGEDAQYELETQNLGMENVTIKTRIEIYKDERSDNLLTKILEEKELKAKHILNIIDTMETKNLPPGEYTATAKIDYGTIDEINQTFRIGEFLVEVEDYDYLFEKDQINKFNLIVKNKWNSPIEELYAEVGITDQGKFITSFKTVSVEAAPWEIKNLTGYFDSTGLEPKRYTANILLSYEGEVTSKLVAIYIKEPPKKTYRIYVIIASIVGFIILLTYILLIRKIRQLSGKKNGKKK